MKFIAENLTKLRTISPLVQNITNYVVMNSTANTLLALGASPVMAHAKEELEEMIAISSALVVNIGTLDEYWIPSMEKAVKIASDLKKPIILDPVGAGATKLRTNTALKLLDIGNVSVLRGNFGEISALLGEHGKTKGVDSAVYDNNEALNISKNASKEFNTVSTVTGPIDYVSNGKEIYSISNGHEMLSKVTGTGCASTSIIGAFLAVEEPLKASVSGLVTYGISAEMAFEESFYPGTFQAKLYDWLYRIDEKLILEKAKVNRIDI
ncbi:Hydroxyethylthiazole kinase [Methanococcus vannielii SB]|jgi:hydroxyethylthiazole kinase|uniref:Hydroxyethylthiazole kinase n=1 Tax=Methanococcus vannielii (strain ATCC 35089 / DSM 1224 / JCM 13029 / OCM 148 / SB) TaxID=406327 RepID=THIM_METVS|nr:hydroxyethylthiazole kinase [Methanococcus vannielii]A6UPE5.1 RecName: Full=Hydroxyethylthiazole kinase; AltName: Full=4-methyl-5-beta-hydroxyethylthiazole kinase; Short=TH kinase; Short=Thz kinase [Methanococcus vannielii SB]ABR54367.1 Hydroxyethylthiazole kinase [Methanococcus vannielii SB]